MNDQKLKELMKSVKLTYLCKRAGLHYVTIWRRIYYNIKYSQKHTADYNLKFKTTLKNLADEIMEVVNDFPYKY